MTDQVADTQVSQDKEKEQLPLMTKVMLVILLLMTTGTVGAIIYLGIKIAETAKSL